MNFKHGSCPRGNYSRTYVTWMNMIQRCTNPKNPRYKDYGGRGIMVEPRWMSFANFLQDMGERPAGKTLDREEVDDHYMLVNCRWATRSEQQRNTTVTRWLEHNGERMCLADWADRIGVKAKSLRARIDDGGWSVEKALTTPMRRLKRL